MPTKSASQSKTVWAGALVAIAGVIKLAANIDITDLVATIANNWDALISIIGACAAIYGRIRARHLIAPKPITGAVSCVPAFLVPILGFAFATVLTFGLTSCDTLTPQQQTAIATTATNLARVAVDAAGTYYAGPLGGQLASDGLNGLAAVLQAYVGNTIPAAIVTASPGVDGVGAAVVKLVAPNHVVSQADVNKVATAAQLAAVLKPALATPPPAAP